MRWLLPIGLVLLAAVLCQWLLGCGVITPVRHATPGGIVIVYHQTDGDYRLPREKVREIDERWAAVLECVPKEAQLHDRLPQVQIVGGECGTVHPYYVPWIRAVVSSSLKGLGHELTHHVTHEVEPPTREEYNTTWLHRCGDAVDREFRKKYPPRACEGDR
jgi:hypothetical protein